MDPSCTVRLTQSSALSPANYFDTPRTSRIGAEACPFTVPIIVFLQIAPLPPPAILLHRTRHVGHVVAAGAHHAAHRLPPQTSQIGKPARQEDDDCDEDDAQQKLPLL